MTASSQDRPAAQLTAWLGRALAPMTASDRRLRISAVVSSGVWREVSSHRPILGVASSRAPRLAMLTSDVHAEIEAARQQVGDR